MKDTEYQSNTSRLLSHAHLHKHSLKVEKSMDTPSNSVNIGDRGVCVSRLSPMGKVNIAGKIYEAKSVDSYIDQRSEVEVVGFENFAVIVKKIN